MNRSVFTIAASCLLPVASFAAALQPSNSYWEPVYKPAVEVVDRSREGLPRWSEMEPAAWPYRPLAGQPVYRLEKNALSEALETTGPHGDGSRIISLPMPDGGLEAFIVTEMSILSPELAARYPEIRTWSLSSADRPEVRGRADLTTLGFSALLITPEGSVQIAPDPELAAPYYLSFYEKDMPDLGAISCQAHSEPGYPDARDKDLPSRLMASGIDRQLPQVASGDMLRTYELAVATTAEYYSGRGNNDSDVLSSIVTVINKVDLIMRSEVAISFVLVDETDDLFFTDADAYLSDGDACALKDENQAVFDNAIDPGDYDIGFVFDARSNTAGGCASGSVVCGANKARGSAGLDTSQVAGHEGFGGYRLVLHEMGHQFGAGHTWSGQANNCTADQFSQPNAYEPGGGTTLMSYSGTCGPIGADSIQSTTGDTYFHGRSFDQIVAFSTGGGDACADTTATGNLAPSVDAGADFTIPRQTPYVLSGSADDPDGNPLTYTWEQFDVASARVPLGTDDGTGPIVRSRIPTSDPTRTIPPWDDILNNTSSPGELLTATDRTMNFRLTARDNLTVGGGVDSDAMVVTVDGDPFFVTAPNGGEEYNAGCPVEVTWAVGGGDVAANVDLFLSTDAGATFSPLLLGTPNDGSEIISVFSCAATFQARVMAAASDNIFFDVSDSNFLVTPFPPTVAVSATGGEVDESCSFTVTFEADVSDDCSVDVNDVDVDVLLLGANAVLGTPVVNKQQVDATSVSVDGSVEVSGLTGSPAQVGIEVTAVDGCGFETGEADIADVIDDMPPMIDVSLSPDTLWAPNHKMRDITATVTAVDNCDVDPEVVLLSIDSNEPVNAEGDGNFEPDVAGADFITEDYEFQLRAERQGGKPGRIYTVTYGTADDSGNMAEDTATVAVPSNQKKK